MSIFPSAFRCYSDLIKSVKSFPQLPPFLLSFWRVLSCAQHFFLFCFRLSSHSFQHWCIFLPHTIFEIGVLFLVNRQFHRYNYGMLKKASAREIAKKKYEAKMAFSNFKLRTNGICMNLMWTICCVPFRWRFTYLYHCSIKCLSDSANAANKFYILCVVSNLFFSRFFPFSIRETQNAIVIVIQTT